MVAGSPDKGHGVGRNAESLPKPRSDFLHSLFDGCPVEDFFRCMIDDTVLCCECKKGAPREPGLATSFVRHSQCPELANYLGLSFCDPNRVFVEERDLYVIPFKWCLVWGIWRGCG